MKLKALIARWRAGRILKTTRKQRRTLRDRRRRFSDHMMTEFEAIYEAEKRYRGLRLFSAWLLEPRPALVPVPVCEVDRRFRRAA